MDMETTSTSHPLDQGPDAPTGGDPRYKWKVMAAVIFGTFMAMGTIFNPNGLIFRTNFLQGINDAYLLTFWLSVATMLLAFTLPGRPRAK